MKLATLESLLLCLLVVLLFAACSRQSAGLKFYPPDPGKPQFTIAAADLAAPAALSKNRPPAGGDATATIRLHFSAARTDAFRQFTRDHLNQQTQFVVGSNVVAHPTVMAEITNGIVDLIFSSLDEARAVKGMLNQE